MKRLAVFLFALLTGCAAPAVSPADSTDVLQTDTSLSVSETTTSAIPPVPPEHDLFAWAHYSLKSGELDIEWLDEYDSDSYRIYNGDTLIGETDNRSEYTYMLDSSDITDNMVFSVEGIRDGKSLARTDIRMHRTEKGRLALDGRDNDTDGDGLSDIDEVYAGTKRFIPDTDGDGLTDGYEYYTSSTDPLRKCSEGSEISDGETDFEKDGLNNREECLSGTNPYNGDSDDDGFPDGYEVHNGMDPLMPDEIIIDKEKAESMPDLDKDGIMAMNTEYYPDFDSSDDYMGYMTSEISIGYNDYGYLNGLDSRYYDGPIENARDALYSLYSLRTLTGIHDPAGDLVYSGSLIERRFDEYTFGQVYKGIPVYCCTVSINVRKPGGEVSLDSYFIPPEVLDRIDITPTVTEDELFDIAKANAKRTPERITSTKLYIFTDPHDITKEPYLGYFIYTDQSEYMQIDAHTGEVTNQGNTYVN